MSILKPPSWGVNAMAQDVEHPNSTYAYADYNVPTSWKRPVSPWGLNPVSVASFTRISSLSWHSWHKATYDINQGEFQG